MILLTRYLLPLGYKGSGMYDDSSSYSHYYKNLPECCAVIVVSNGIVEPYIGVFRLTEQQYQLFLRGHLSLVPNNCCSPTYKNQVKGCDVLFKGEFKNHKHAAKLLATFEAALRAESRKLKAAQLKPTQEHAKNLL